MVAKKVFASAVLSCLLPSGSALSRLFAQQQCLNDAWLAFDAGTYEQAIRQADRCIGELSRSADQEQERLRAAKTPLPPTGRVSAIEKVRIESRGSLNDTATAYFIKGAAAERLIAAGKNSFQTVRKESNEAACRYTYARAWDPRGWFWSPCEATQQVSSRWVPMTPNQLKLVKAVLAEQEGREAIKRGDWSAVREKYTVALAAYGGVPGTAPDQTSSFMWLAMAEQRVGDGRQAVLHFLQAIKTLQSAKPWVAALPDDGNVGVVRRSLRETEDPINIEALCYRGAGLGFASAGLYKEAYESLEASIIPLSILPNNARILADTYERVGLVLENLGRFEEEVENLKQALRLYEKMPNSDAERARCQARIASVSQKKSPNPETGKSAPGRGATKK